MPELIEPEQFLSLDEPTVAIVRVAVMGDIVAAEPVLRCYVCRKYPKAKKIWLVGKEFVELVRFHPLLDYVLPVQHIDEATTLAKECMNRGNRVINLHFTPIFCRDTGVLVTNDNDPSISAKNYYLRGNLLQAFCETARIPIRNDAPIFFIDPNVQLPDLPKKYVVFHCVSRDQKRNWDIRKWQKLLYFFIHKNIHVVEIGLEPILKSRNPLYIDLTSVHSLQVLAAVLAKACFFVGIDSGFAHIANALRVEGLVILGKFYVFDSHVPYSGLYAHDHIVRVQSKPAFDVPYEAVVNHILLHNADILSE